MNILVLDDEREIADLVEVYLKMRITMFLNFTMQKKQ